MLYAGLDLSRKRLDFHLLDAEGATVELGAAPVDADGLRGLSERLERHGTPIRGAIFNAVFFVVVVSALAQGTTLEWFAERLGLVDPRPTVVTPPIEVDALGSLELVEFDVAGDHAIAGAFVRELGLPRSALIAVVARGAHTIPPRGSTVIEPGDRLFVLAPRSARPELEDVFTRWRQRI
jgi:cell volume regulation protein A